MSRGSEFRNRVLAQKTVWSAGAYDALSARFIEAAGFDALMTSGFGVSASFLGQPDAELYTMSENLTAVRNVVSAVNVPVIADIDTGYGNAINVMRTIREFEAAGVSAVIMEDQVAPILFTITNHWVDLTRGPMGITDIPPMAIDSARPTYYFVLALVLATAYLCHALVSSRTGRAFLAVRENAPLAASLGINVFHTKLLGFVAATAIAGIGGAIYAHYIRIITPDIMGVHNVAALIIVVIIGGRGTILGPILGALVYIGLLESLRVAGPLRMVIFAALLTGPVVFLPGGLVVLDHGVKIAEGAPAKVLNNAEVIRVYLGREPVDA